MKKLRIFSVALFILTLTATVTTNPNCGEGDALYLYTTSQEKGVIQHSIRCDGVPPLGYVYYVCEECTDDVISWVKFDNYNTTKCAGTITSTEE